MRSHAYCVCYERTGSVYLWESFFLVLSIFPFLFFKTFHSIFGMVFVFLSYPICTHDWTDRANETNGWMGGWVAGQAGHDAVTGMDNACCGQGSLFLQFLFFSSVFFYFPFFSALCGGCCRLHGQEKKGVARGTRPNGLGGSSLVLFHLLFLGPTIILSCLLPLPVFPFRSRLLFS